MLLRATLAFIVLLGAAACADPNDHTCDFSDQVESERQPVGSEIPVTLVADATGDALHRWRDLDAFGELWDAGDDSPTTSGFFDGTATLVATHRVEVALEDGSVVDFGLIGCA